MNNPLRNAVSDHGHDSEWQAARRRHVPQVIGQALSGQFFGPILEFGRPKIACGSEQYRTRPEAAPCPVPGEVRFAILHARCYSSWWTPPGRLLEEVAPVAQRVKRYAFLQMNVEFDCLPGCDSEVVSNEGEESRSRHLSCQLVSSGRQVSY